MTIRNPDGRSLVVFDSDGEDDGRRVVVCDAKGCHPRVQSVPRDDEETEAFLRTIGWRSEPNEKHSCPFCAGGAHLEKLKAVFEGRGKDNLS